MTNRADDAALFARIDAVVSGHEQQRSMEGAPGDWDVALPLGVFSATPAAAAALRDSFAMTFQRIARDFAETHARIAAMLNMTGEQLNDLLKRIAETGKLPPPPFKRSKHVYGR